MSIQQDVVHAHVDEREHVGSVKDGYIQCTCTGRGNDS